MHALLILTVVLITLSVVNAIFSAWVTALDARYPSALGAMVAVAALTAIPARIGARRSVSGILRAELA
jgi:Mg2+/Co2+ transporter CorB